jgi:hypothetical protein
MSLACLSPCLSPSTSPSPPCPPPQGYYPAASPTRGPACRLDLVATLTATRHTARTLAAAVRRGGLCGVYGDVCGALKGKLLCAGEGGRGRGGGGRGSCELSRGRVTCKQKASVTIEVLEAADVCVGPLQGANK